MQAAILPASSEVRPTNRKFSDEVPNLVVDEMEPVSDDKRSNSTTTRRHRARGRGLAGGGRGKRTIVSRGTIVMNTSEKSNSNSRPIKGRKRKAPSNTDDTVEKRILTSEGTSKRDVCCVHFNCDIRSK